MITSLRSGEIDVGIGLTEGWVAGLGKDDIEGDGGYRIVGTYVETPLCKKTLTCCHQHQGAHMTSRLGNFDRLKPRNQQRR